MVDKTKSRGQVAGIRGMPRLRLRALRREPAITWDMSPVWSFRSTPPQRPDEGCAPSSDDYRSPASLSMLIRQKYQWTARESNPPSLVCKTSVTSLRLPAHGAEDRACGLLLYLIVYPEVRKCLLSPSESG